MVCTDACSSTNQSYHSFVALLWTPQGLSVLSVAKGPMLNTIQGVDHLFCPAGYTISHTSHDAIRMPLAFLATLLTHIQLSMKEHPQILFLCTDFQQHCPKLAMLHGVVAAQVQYTALGLVEPHPNGFNSAIQSVQIPL